MCCWFWSLHWICRQFKQYTITTHWWDFRTASQSPSSFMWNVNPGHIKMWKKNKRSISINSGSHIHQTFQSIKEWVTSIHPYRVCVSPADIIISLGHTGGIVETWWWAAQVLLSPACWDHITICTDTFRGLHTEAKQTRSSVSLGKQG